jgi:hypothetical protein
VRRGARAVFGTIGGARCKPGEEDSNPQAIMQAMGQPAITSALMETLSTPAVRQLDANRSRRRVTAASGTGAVRAALARRTAGRAGRFGSLPDRC